ncbi:MAG: hypothetical protein R2795_00325 [Saprospiraceae bacterium]
METVKKHPKKSCKFYHPVRPASDSLYFLYEAGFPGLQDLWDVAHGAGFGMARQFVAVLWYYYGGTITNENTEINV